VVALLVATGVSLALVWPSSRRSVSYSRDVQSIFDAKCVSCHPVAYPYLDLRRGRSYAQLVGVVSPLSPAFERVLPGRPELSYLLTHVPDPSRRHLLGLDERSLIARWISQGAKDN
jgi:hypothetical protein